MLFIEDCTRSSKTSLDVIGRSLMSLFAFGVFERPYIRNAAETTLTYGKLKLCFSQPTKHKIQMKTYENNIFFEPQTEIHY